LNNGLEVLINFESGVLKKKVGGNNFEKKEITDAKGFYGNLQNFL